jgi:hypothetical protein
VLLGTAQCRAKGKQEYVYEKIPFFPQVAQLLSRISPRSGRFSDPAEEARYRAFAARSGDAGSSTDDGIDLCMAQPARVTLRRWGEALWAGSFLAIQVSRQEGLNTRLPA